MIPFASQDLAALELMIGRSDGSEFKRRRLIERVRKDYRAGRLAYGPGEVPDHAWKLCEARLMLGNWFWHGWQFRSEWAASWAANLVKDGVSRWKGQYVDRLYVYGEQGVGDEIFFGQALPWLKTRVGRVVLETDPRLCSVFSRLGIECVPTTFADDGEKRIRKMAKVDGNAWTLLGDLIVRSGPQPVPYLTAKQVARFAHYRGRVGVSWRGNQGSYACRDFDVERPLSLQYDQAWDEDVEVPVDCGGRELDLRNDIEGLLGLLANLSAVVSVSTSVAHFAAASGVRTDVVLAPRNGPNANVLPWKWVSNANDRVWRTAWYSGVRTYRDLRDYRSRHVSAGQGLGKANRAVHGSETEGSELAAA